MTGFNGSDKHQPATQRSTGVQAGPTTQTQLKQHLTFCDVCAAVGGRSDTDVDLPGIVHRVGQELLCGIRAD